MPRQYTMSDKARAARSKGGKAAQTLDAYITRIVDRAPELTDAQIARLRTLLRPVSGGSAE
ncbi:hypothetical protein EJ357_44650 [Streptomyces cyaneochromogenes]|uniref:Uncharacterized protein n=1 Tax=Streptomyces cyaneochromogenes TaxID=2496836 RepID=A0A3S9MKD7_9ACTN|nr:hypothetical protein [Streptomyces cyaneochromogenes]AZQ39654.1 hypothetical protein EJ357_44650 [Streptomyces cyaneochromogenes]